ncbi:hypothetical protein GCK72_012358 [Caenorhabditis remanei]|uniref:Uncharacterized protein n=1 Tax=Caenorhabditis remanei TaxID=31234 RepID=A0A6A5GMY3_CAERE|nr:hypothetical protein GCK72_012358 [Caenorhabditis remanei]KAF1755905.1 hypothetical protein GCK72_012358 [Caenorhabditis remanei]
MSEHSKRKEANCHTPTARIQQKNPPPKTVSFRTVPYEKVFTEDGETLEKAPANDFLHLNNNGFDGEDVGLLTQPVQNQKNISKSGNSSGICPFEVGEKLSELPKEQLNTYHRQLYDSMFPRLSFNYATVDYIISNGSDPDSKALAYGIKGIMELMELQNQKFTQQKPSDSIGDTLATLDPSSFLNQEEVEVSSMYGTELISINRVFASVPAQSGSLRSILQSLANIWISQIMSHEDRVMFSTSEKPKTPQVSLPTRFLNLPIPLIYTCVNMKCTKDESVKLNIALFFKMHVTNLFNQARNDAKTARKRKHVSSPAT